ncbi:MAG TPA: hypothetical protein VM238_18755 [Phycisphaerae bacterium]|nr:hypothetical protein [Phycisphaerae bacterium]
MRTAGALTLVFLALLLAGCDETAPPDLGPRDVSPPDLPCGAPTPNCVTTNQGIPNRPPGEEDEVIVVGRCTEVRQYAKTRHGQWEHWWYVVAFDVFGVERGVWPHPRVVFCCYDAWPTPESGIEVKKSRFLFVEGRVFALALEPQAEPPPLLVGQEWRSRVPPHGKTRLLSFDLQSEEGKRFYDRLWAAVRAFAEQNGWPDVTGAVRFEETDDAYVLEVALRTDDEANRRAVAVDKETFAVREVP